LFVIALRKPIAKPFLFLPEIFVAFNNFALSGLSVIISDEFF